MSNAALEWAFDCRVRGPAKAVLIVLADHADDEGCCWPSQERIAHRAGVALRTVRNAIDRLVEAGILTTGPGPYGALRYTLEVGSSPAPRAEPAPTAPGTTCRMDRQDVPPPPAPRAADPGTTCRQTLKNPYTPQETSSPSEPSEAPPPPANPVPPPPPPEGWLFDPPPRPAPADPPTAREVLWREGLPILRALIGKSEPQTRALLGQLLRDMADDCPAVLAQIRAAHDLQPAEPVAWLRRSCTSPEVRRRAEMAEVDRGMWRGKPITAHNRPPSALVGGLG